MRFVPRYCLKDLRELNRLTLEQVARKVKLNRERIAELEQDSSFIAIDEMFRFSKFYDISIKYIFIGEQVDFDRKLNEYLGGRK
nr:helix-turn-helix transcriptional regulator [Lactococcus lactis]